MADYIYKIGNYNTEFIKSGFIGEGYTDLYNADYAQAKQLNEAAIRQSFGSPVGSDILYDFCIIPNIGFLGTNDPLPVNTEVKLSWKHHNEFGNITYYLVFVLMFRSE